MYLFFFNSSKLAVLILFLLVYCNSHSQSTSKIDSLKSALSDATDSGDQKLDILYGLAYELFDVDNQQAVDYANESYSLASELGDSLKMVRSGRISGQIHRRLDKLNESIAVLLKVLPIAKRQEYVREEKLILNALAIAYTFQANYDKALDYHFESLVIREKEGDKKEISTSLNNIGVVYYKLRNFSQAIEYYKRSLKLMEEGEYSYNIARLYVNIGLCYNDINDFEQALTYLNKGFQSCGENCPDEIRVEGNFGLGISYFGLRSNIESEKFLKESLKIAVATDNKRFQAENLIALSRISEMQNKRNEAVASLKQTETIAIESGYNEILISVYRELSGLFNQSEEFKEAAFYQNQYIHLKDSVYSDALIKNLAKVQAEYQERENMETIAVKNVQLKRQRDLNAAIVVIAILASLLIFVLYRANRVRKRVNLALSDAKAIIEDQNRQLMSSNFNLDRELKVKNTELQKANESLLRVNDELDNFIYKTSHDIRGPLASLKGMCNVALMDVKDDLALNYLHKLDITAEKLNTILTRLLIVNQINNSAIGFDKIDLVEIVNDVLLLEKKKGFPSRLNIKTYVGENIEFHSDKEFIRIILENLVDNAIKFYNDSDRIEPFVEISITQEAHHVKIKVVDNGIGISEVHPDKIFQMFSRASERSETGGIGLYITKTAAEKLGGIVDLRTNRDGHTEFSVRLPMSQSRVFV